MALPPAAPRPHRAGDRLPRRGRHRRRAGGPAARRTGGARGARRRPGRHPRAQRAAARGGLGGGLEGALPPLPRRAAAGDQAVLGAVRAAGGRGRDRDGPRHGLRHGAAREHPARARVHRGDLRRRAAGSRAGRRHRHRDSRDGRGPARRLPGDRDRQRPGRRRRGPGERGAQRPRRARRASAAGIWPRSTGSSTWSPRTSRPTCCCRWRRGSSSACRRAAPWCWRACWRASRPARSARPTRGSACSAPPSAARGSGRRCCWSPPRAGRSSSWSTSRGGSSGGRRGRCATARRRCCTGPRT